MPGSQEDGVIRGIPVLDLSHAREPEDLAHIKEIVKVAMVIIPEHLAGVLQRVPMRAVTNVIAVPKGAHVRVHTGSVMLGGESLAEPGDNEVLVVTGTLIVTSPVTTVGYRRMHVTGMVLAPRGSESALGAGLTGVTGAVVYYELAENQTFKQFSGETKLSGETLANAGGSPDDVLIVAGQLVVTSKVVEVGFQRVVTAGVLLAPRQAEPALAPVLNTSGAVVWYSGSPRFFLGDETYGREFFELLDGPIELAFAGNVTIADDGITPELLREKVSALTLVGMLRAPKEVVPFLQVLTTEKSGRIVAYDGGK